jgi:CRISPR-associated DxTHG motif protein
MDRTVVITFLGVRPKLTQYKLQDKIGEGEVFAKALHQLIRFDQMLVCATEQAHNECWHVVEELQDERILEIHIPEGRNPEEMWQIFERILSYVKEDDEVIFDITHGLRSLPFLVFLFAAYLQFARQAKIKAIYYGALELKDSGIAPVLELTDFVAMLDWLVATDQFIQTGNAQRLANLINSGRNRELSKAAEKLIEVSQAALWSQPFKLMKSAKTLNMDVNIGGKQSEQRTIPFSILQERVVSTYSQFAAKPSNLEEAVKKEYQMILWYLEKSQIVQAVTLAREWLIDVITWKLGYPWSLETTDRKIMERGISGLARLGRADQSEEQVNPNEVARKLQGWPEKGDLCKFWDTLSSVRNSFDHAEHQKDSMKLKTIRKNINEIQKQLQALAALWKIT